MMMLLQVQEYEEEIDSSAVLIHGHNRRFTSVVRSSPTSVLPDPLRYTEEDTLRAMDPDSFYEVRGEKVGKVMLTVHASQINESTDKEVESTIRLGLIRSQQQAGEESCPKQR